MLCPQSEGESWFPFPVLSLLPHPWVGTGFPGVCRDPLPATGPADQDLGPGRVSRWSHRQKGAPEAAWSPGPLPFT